MTSRRTARLSEAIRQTVSTVILMELRDPRIRDVTVTKVEAAADLRTAKVYVSIMGDDKKQSLALHGLNSARGYLQSKVADRLQTRYTPVLRFVLDEGVKRSLEAARILREVLGPDLSGTADAAAGDPVRNSESPEFASPESASPDAADSSDGTESFLPPAMEDTSDMFEPESAGSEAPGSKLPGSEGSVTDGPATDRHRSDSD